MQNVNLDPLVSEIRKSTVAILTALSVVVQRGDPEELDHAGRQEVLDVLRVYLQSC